MWLLDRGITQVYNKTKTIKVVTQQMLIQWNDQSVGVIMNAVMIKLNIYVITAYEEKCWFC